MALLWIDGFTHYGADGTGLPSNALGAYDSIGTDSVLEQLSGSSLFGFTPSTAAASYPIPASGVSLQKILPASKTSGSLGLGAHLELTPATASYSEYPFAFLSAENSALFFVRVSKDTGVIGLYAGSTSIGTSGSFALSKGVVYHLEVRLVIAGSLGGSFELRVNGVTRVSVTGITTNATAINSFGLRYRDGSFIAGRNVMGNVYAWDETGTENNDWLGERNVYTLMPNADTAQADWTLSTGSSGYALIDNVPSAPTTDYLQSSAVNNESSFGIEALPSTDILIKGIQVVLQGQKTGTSSNEVEYGLDDGTNKTSSGNTPLTQNSVLYNSFITETSPTTGVAWDPSEIDALLVYVKRTT